LFGGSVGQKFQKHVPPNGGSLDGDDSKTMVESKKIALNKHNSLFPAEKALINTVLSE